jgi:hypothetical protein
MADYENIQPKFNQSALKPLSTNKMILPRTSSPQGCHSAKAKRKLGSSETRLNVISEDGEFSTMNASKTRNGQSTRQSVASKRAKGPLDGLLETRTPAKPVLKTLATNHQSDASPEPASETDSPVHEPYRRKPKTELRPEHFKINSAYNQGLNYAFEEVVRNRDQRRCFPGCTRPECCGDKFRKMVEIGGMPQLSRKGVQWDAPTDDDEQQLLESYLGDDREQLDLMTADERREILIQAQAKQLADKFGRHKQAYERRRTPPGFWRTDMPTTQELESDRDAAEKIESEKVKERYREALRSGGRYRFRDE